MRRTRTMLGTPTELPVALRLQVAVLLLSTVLGGVFLLQNAFLHAFLSIKACGVCAFASSMTGKYLAKKGTPSSLSPGAEVQLQPPSSIRVRFMPSYVSPPQFSN